MGDERSTHPIDQLLPTIGPFVRSARQTREMAAVPDDLEPLPGMLIDGCYRVLSRIGEGGMGVVMRALDERLQREVAIKVVHHDQLGSRAARDQFLREARAMAQLRHINLVEVHAFGEFGGRPYLVMEHVPGTDLESWLSDRGAEGASIDEALGLLDQLCRGVSALHAARAVHRDLKPSNVLIGPGFRVAITDFGLARRITDGTDAQVLAGTPAYIAPEVVEQLPVAHAHAHAVDVYALGVIAFEMLTGRLPFLGRCAVELLEQQVHDAPPSPSRLRPELTAAFDRAILRALAKDPARRTASAEQFRRELIEARSLLGRAARPLQVLVADDDAGCRLGLVRFIEDVFPGSVTTAVSDGKAALEFATRYVPDLVVADLGMPGLNGIELSAALRARARTRHIPIVVLTGIGGAPDWQVLRELGVAALLVKPTDADALTAVIERVTKVRADERASR